MEPAPLLSSMFCSDKSIEADASTLLHPFEDKTEIHGELNSQVFVGLKNVEPSQDGALVIR